MPEPIADTTLDADDLQTWTALATVLEWLPPALDAELVEFGLSHFEYGVLYALADASDRNLRLSVLADYANSTLSRLSRAISRLEHRGWVRRETDPDDGRFTRACLTTDGFRRFSAATPTHEANVRRLVLEVLTPAQRTQLREIAEVLAGAIRAGSRSPSTPT